MKYILLFLIGSVSVYAQGYNKLDENGKRNGIWKGIFEESKRPRYEGVFNHGVEEGVFKFFDDTKVGTIIATREFNSKDNSCYTIFYNQKGNKVSEGKIVNKEYEGDWKYYHEDSPQIMTLEVYSKGKLNGIKKVYLPSGKIAEETTYKNGLREGAYKKYIENGTVLEESIYKNNEYHGIAIFRSPENVIVGKGLFTNGKKTGMWEFNNDGKIKKENMNKQGKKFVKRTTPLQVEK